MIVRVEASAQPASGVEITYHYGVRIRFDPRDLALISKLITLG